MIGKTQRDTEGYFMKSYFDSANYVSNILLNEVLRERGMDDQESLDQCSFESVYNEDGGRSVFVVRGELTLFSIDHYPSERIIVKTERR